MGGRLIANKKQAAGMKPTETRWRDEFPPCDTLETQLRNEGISPDLSGPSCWSSAKAPILHPIPWCARSCEPGVGRRFRRDEWRSHDDWHSLWGATERSCVDVTWSHSTVSHGVI